MDAITDLVARARYAQSGQAERDEAATGLGNVADKRRRGRKGVQP